MKNLFALVPAKDPQHGKSRLAPILGDGERRALNLSLARRTLEVCIRHFGAGRTIAASSAPSILALAGELGAWGVADPGPREDINSALAAATEFALARGAEGVVVVPTDLTLIAEDALAQALAAMPEAPACLLVPDRHGTGTNLLALAPARTDLFLFGELSLKRHAAAASRLGYNVKIVDGTSLGLDLDTPADYRHLEAMER